MQVATCILVAYWPLQIVAKPLQIATWLLLTAYKELTNAVSNGTIAKPIRHTI